MKRMKGLTALAVIGAMVSGMGALPTAAAYDPCDVNRDGMVSMTDVIAINQHLAGTRYFTDYNQLDANQSHTIDKTDSNCVLQKLVANSYSACYIRQYPNAYMEVVNMPSVSSTVALDSSVNETTGRTYKRYSYTEGRYLDSYTLTPTNTTLASTHSSQPRALINSDDNRGVAHGYENTGIVYLENLGTGFIVGNHQIATAAHCVCSGTNIRTDIRIFTYDRSGELDGGELHIAEIHVPEEYKNWTSNLYDYALITVTEDLSDHVQFDIGNAYNITNSAIGSIPIHVTGVPSKLGDNLDISNYSNTLYTHYGSIYGSSNQSLLHHTVDTYKGQSGSPVYTITRERYNGTDYYTYTALAVHTNGPNSVYNYGTLMTKHHLMLYGNNPNISYQ